jgi:trimethylamine--corrinoid protein Co-methyltransferase
MMAALSGVNMVSGPGMLDFESCQSLENLVLANEVCAMALRAVRGIERREGPLAKEIIDEGIAAEQFLNLDHTRKWFRKEYYFPGAVIDRAVGDVWETSGKKTALQRARDEVERLLAKDGAPPLEAGVQKSLDDLMRIES